MKIAAALLVTASTASAFVPMASKNSAVVRMSEESTEAAPLEEAVVEEVAEPVVVAPVMSQSMPFMEVSPALDGSMAGDVGFDPLGFAKNSEDLMNYREAEVCRRTLSVGQIGLINVPCSHIIYLFSLSFDLNRSSTPVWPCLQPLVGPCRNFSTRSSLVPWVSLPS